MTERRSRRAVATLFFAIVAAFTLPVLLGDASATSAALSSAPPRAVLTAVSLATANYGLRFARWQLLLRALSLSIPVGSSLLVFLAGFSMSVTPGKMGELYKSWLLAERHGVPVERTAGTVVVERAMDLVALLVLGTFGSAFVPGTAILIVPAVALVAVIVAVLLSRPLAEACLSLLGRVRRLASLEGRLRAAYVAMRALLTPRVLVLGVSLSVVSWSLEVLAMATIADALAPRALSLGAAAFVYAAPTLFGAVAMLPGGLGATEVGMIGALRLATGGSFPAPEAAAATLLIRLATLWWSVALGVVALVAARVCRR